MSHIEFCSGRSLNETAVKKSKEEKMLDEESVSHLAKSSKVAQRTQRGRYLDRKIGHDSPSRSLPGSKQESSIETRGNPRAVGIGTRVQRSKCTPLED